MKIWLDDVREPPDATWTWVKTSQAAISLLRYTKEPITEVSLDHDLGLYDTGVPVARYLSAMVQQPEYPKIVIHIHSMNPVGSERLQAEFGIVRGELVYPERWGHSIEAINVTYGNVHEKGVTNADAAEPLED